MGRQTVGELRLRAYVENLDLLLMGRQTVGELRRSNFCI